MTESQSEVTHEPAQEVKAVAPEPAPAAGSAGAVARVLSAQQTAGNRAVARMVVDGWRGELGGRRRLTRTPVHIRGTFQEARTGGRVAAEGLIRFDVDLTGDQAVITVKMKLVPDHGVSALQAATVQAQAEAAFVAMWDNRFILTDRASNDRFFLRVRVQWVNTGQHIRIRLRPGDLDIDQTRWSVRDLPVEFAHEISHTLGLRDEYVDPTYADRRTVTSPGTHIDHSLMGNYFTEGIGLAEVKLRHAQLVAAEIGRACRPRRTFDVSYTLSTQGERLVRWRGIRDAAGAGTPERAAAAAEVTAIEQDMLIPQLSHAAGVPYAPTP